jgi:hypothetical protein
MGEQGRLELLELRQGSRAEVTSCIGREEMDLPTLYAHAILHTPSLAPVTLIQVVTDLTWH